MLGLGLILLDHATIFAEGVHVALIERTDVGGYWQFQRGRRLRKVRLESKQHVEVWSVVESPSHKIVLNTLVIECYTDDLVQRVDKYRCITFCACNKKGIKSH